MPAVYWSRLEADTATPKVLLSRVAVDAVAVVPHVFWSRLATDQVLSIPYPQVWWSATAVDVVGLGAAEIWWSELAVDGALDVTLNPVTTQTVEPRATATVTVTVATGPNPDSYTWRQISGPTVTITGSGNSRSFTAPHVMPPTSGSVVLGVKGTYLGADTPEVTATVTIPPQLRWTWNGTGWVGAGYVEA